MGDERWEDAVVAFQQFLEAKADLKSQAMAYSNLSACYLALERYEEALDALDEVERSTPDDPANVQSRGVIYACAGRISEALATFEELVRRWPRQARRFETQNALRQLRRIERGEAPPGDYLVDHLQEQVEHNVEMGDFHVVERKARRMIAANPQRSEGHFALGVACLEQHRYDEALDALLDAHDRNPDHVPTLYDIGHVHLQMDEAEQAILWLERALRRNPEHLSALHQLGVAYEQLGRQDEAVEQWQRALGIDSDYHLAQQRLHEVGQGPEPTEPPLPPKFQQMKRLTPIIKDRMKHPHVHRNGGLTLTYDGQVGFVLEDKENRHNATVYAGAPFRTSQITDSDRGMLLDMIGVAKLTLQMINVENTRDVAVLTYYDDRPVFSYQARFERNEMVEFDASGQFVVTEVPRFFKLRIDSDLSTPYGAPMQGMLIYLKQSQRPDILISTLGLLSQ
jgi:tetratricopeptide (TPR) repeat protein